MKNIFVIPFNNAKWVVATKKDIYYSFPLIKKLTHITYIDAFFLHIERIAKQQNIDLTDTNYDKLKEQLKQVQMNDSMFNKFEYDNLWDNIIEYMKPERNDFNLATTKDLYHNLKKYIYKDYAIEIWTESECVFINKNIVDEDDNNTDFIFLKNLLQNLKQI